MKKNSQETDNHKLIVILGPTASGKSDLAVQLAKQFNGEIISADSRQVYRGMDIGTGKVPLKKCFQCQTSHSLTCYKNMLSPELVTSGGGKPNGCYKGIPHYLLNVANPKRRFTVAQYKKLALVAIKKILKKGKMPIICGGTGFYIQAVVDNIAIPEVKPDLKLRAELEKKSVGELFSELKKLDPERAKNIDRYNKRRLIRALEIIYKTGKPVPPLNPPHPSFKKEGDSSLFKGRLGGILFFDVLFLGVKKSPTELKKLIHKRLIARLRQGMVKEVENLRQSDLSWKRLDSFGLEYRWIARYLQQMQSPPFKKGRVEGILQSPSSAAKLKKNYYNEMTSRLQKDIEHYAKRQMTWFKRDKRIKWVKNSQRAQKLIKNFLK